MEMKYSDNMLNMLYLYIIFILEEQINLNIY